MRTDQELLAIAQREGVSAEYCEKRAEDWERRANAAEQPYDRRGFEKMAEECKRMAAIIRKQPLGATNMTKIFEVTTTTIEDGSEVFDIVAKIEGEDQYLLWNAPSERTARLCADALNDVCKAFMQSGSDYEALRLAGRIIGAITY